MDAASALDTSRTPRWKPFAAGILLVALVTTAYAPAAQNGFIWDDDAYVVKNSTLPDSDGLGRIWFEFGATPQYYPLVHSAFWLEYRLWGLEPAGYHVVNVILHGFLAVLIWRLLLFLSVPGAWAAAAIFALHPVHVETVAWITERKNVLSGVFYLGAALAYLRFAAARENPGTPVPYAAYTLSFLLFAAALLSKTVVCSLPAALLLVLWWKRGSLGVKDVVPLLPFFALGLSLAGVTVWMEKHRVGAVGPDWDLSFAERTLIAARALWFYLGKLAWPNPLSFIYPRWAIDTGSPAQIVYPAAVLGLAAALWAARVRIGRAPLVAALLFAGTLLPALGFIDIYPMRYSFVADHFQYLASIAPIALVAAGGAQLSTRFAARFWPTGPRVAAAVLVTLLGTLGALTWNQLQNYRNLETLWTATIETNPGAWIAYYNLGNQRRQEKNWPEAIRLYRAALAQKEDLSLAENNLAGALSATGDLDGAIFHFRRAIEIDDQYTRGYFNLASVLASNCHYAEAIEHYETAVLQQPEYGAAHHRLGLALQQIGESEAALPHLRKAEQIRRKLEKRVP